MRRILALFTMLMLCGLLASAQNRVVSGKVTDKDGVPVPFASIKIRGTRIGTQADAAGVYTIKVKDGDVLQITAANHTDVEVIVGSQSFISTSLDKTGNLTEVVVTTAFNRKTSARSATSNVQVVTGENLNTVRNTNVNNALAGKAAGIQIRSQSPAALGRQTEIRLRGDGGLGGGAGPIYVVEGTILPNSNDINPDDIEDLSVLNGPQAAALFGAVGQNGAIVITLKKARKSNRMGIEVNSGIMFDKVYVLPRYQDSYAGGISQDMTQYNYVDGVHPVEWKALDGKYYHDYYDDGSWGPRIAGQEYIPWYAWYGGHEDAFKTQKLVAQPNNIRDFYNTGVTLNNNISFSKATDNTSIRVSYSNIDIKGLLPTTSQKRNTFSTVMSFDLSTKLTLAANINYYSSNTYGMVEDGYGNQASGSFNQWFHRDLEIDKLRNLKDLRARDGVYASWNLDDPNSYNPDRASRELWGGKYWMNHFKFFDLATTESRNDRLYGNVGLTYKFNSELQLKATYRKQQNTTYFEQKFSSQIYNSTWDPNVFGVDGRWGGYYATSNSYSNIENYESQIIWNKKIKDFGINAFAGIDIRRALVKSNGANTNADPGTFSGFKVEDLYTISNSAIEPTVTNGRSDDKRRAVYAAVDLSYKNFLFLNGTVRRDWFSSLPPTNPGVTSKSVGVGFVFSDLVKADIPFLSYGKLRGSWGEAPNAIDPYVYPGFLYGVGQNNWNGNGLSGTPDQIVDPLITGAVKLMADIGVDLRFLNNRLGVSFTYYDGSEKDLPFTVPVATSSGFTSLVTNVGLITKKGIEVSALFRPIWTRNFKWEMTGNWGKILDNTVVEIADSVNTFPVGTGNNSPVNLVHIKGEQWGNLYGGGMKRLNGQPILDADGFYTRDPLVNFGSVLPNFTGGIQNRFDVFTNFTFSFNIDFQSGGKFFSLSDNYGTYSGLYQKTAELNDKGIPQRDPVSAGGGVRVDGVDETGKAVTFYIDSREYWRQFTDNDIRDANIYDLTFVKLREVGLTYKIPVSSTKWGKKIQAASFSILLRNPWLIYSKAKDFDPSEISGVTGESGNLPGTRGVGVNLRISF
jgi:TonB-linked SusC/RagA family outer membrane protein